MPWQFALLWAQPSRLNPTNMQQIAQTLTIGTLGKLFRTLSPSVDITIICCCHVKPPSMIPLAASIGGLHALGTVSITACAAPSVFLHSVACTRHRQKLLVMCAWCIPSFWHARSMMPADNDWTEGGNRCAR